MLLWQFGKYLLPSCILVVLCRKLLSAQEGVALQAGRALVFVLPCPPGCPFTWLYSTSLFTHGSCSIMLGFGDFCFACSKWSICLSLVIILRSSISTREGDKMDWECMRCRGHYCVTISVQDMELAVAPTGFGVLLVPPPAPSAVGMDQQLLLCSLFPTLPPAFQMSGITWPISVRYSDEKICASVSSSCQTMQVTELQFCACLLQWLLYSKNGTMVPLCIMWQKVFHAYYWLSLCLEDKLLD